ncbi:MAG: TonB-dependent receptor [Bacteroidales bacterium]|nr:TonB-dependent receptor [Bacteroidales bacterium]MBN2762740.1 TonB-dependent receptor [Bacteroidales bacterium]
MKTICLILLTLLLFKTSLLHAQQESRAVIEGRIFNAGNNEPIPFASIVIYGTTIGSISDLDGNFLFTGLEPGFIRLQASSIGFEPVITEEYQLTNAKKLFIEIPMQEANIELSAVVVKASPFRRQEESPVSLKIIEISEIEKNPGSNRDISRVIQSFPGVSSTVSFRNDLIVRGGGPSENRFYLDGIEIPNLNHFATQGASGGPAGIINVDFLREVEYYSGAFPSNRGNALSSVFDFSQIDGNKEKIKFKGSIGASDLSITLDGPISDNTTFIASARRSYLQLLFTLLKLPFLPTYSDFQFKVKSRIDEKNEISLIGIGAIDQSSLNLKADETPEQRYILEYLPVNEQWNYAVGAVYKHYRERGFNTLVVSRNYLNNVSYKYANNNPENIKTFNYASTEAENKLRFEHFTRTESGYKFVSGINLEYAQYTNETSRQLFTNDTLTKLYYNSELNTTNYGAFSQVSKAFLDRKLTLSLGIRIDGSAYSSEMANPLKHFSPRISASYLLNDIFSLNFNSGRYYQRPPYTALGYRNAAGELENKQNNITYIRADHFVGGVELRPSPNSIITLEGFYKLYDNYPFSLLDSISLASKGGDFGTFGDEPLKSVSKGRTYGFEVYAKSKDLLGFNTILSYTYVNSQSIDLDENLEPLDTYTPTSWDNRHILILTATRKFKRNWFVGGKWRFVGGAPYTVYDYDKSSIKAAWDARGRAYWDFSKFNEERLNSFHQLDLRIDKQYFFRKWSLNLYVDVQNVYNNKSDTPDNLVREATLNGSPVENDPYIDENGIERYRLTTIESDGSGTVLPTVGIIVEF